MLYSDAVLILGVSFQEIFGRYDEQKGWEKAKILRRYRILIKHYRQSDKDKAIIGLLLCRTNGEKCVRVSLKQITEKTKRLQRVLKNLGVKRNIKPRVYLLE